MSNPVPYLIQGKNIILVIDGKSHTISKDTHVAYTKIVEALKAEDWDALRDLVEPKKVFVDFGMGNVSIEDGEVYWKGEPFHNALASRLMEMFSEGFPVDPMVNFMENLMDNPSKRSVDQVYGFLEKNNLPITPDGYFLAYKRVRSDYLDVHTGTIDNRVGQVVEMDRNRVDDNPNSTCSTGLHFCSESYLGSFGSGHDPVMILKINPADVVSIPTDYDGAKGRCCRYEVVGQVKGDPKDAFASIVNGEYSPVDEIFEDEFLEDDFVEVNEEPYAAWPFATGNSSPDEVARQMAAAADETEVYSVVRVYGGAVEATDLTLEDAEEMVEKNIRQKKAQLKILDSYGDEV